MNEVYLIRHGIAADREDYANDEERPLTKKGRKKTKKVAKRLHKLGLKFERILSSPLVRSRQTAKILKAAKLSYKIEISPHLAPEGNIHSWISWLEQWQQQHPNQSLALVGHQPDLGNWAEILLWWEAREKIILKKAGIIGLKLPESGNPIGQSSIFCAISPKWLL